eukprot:SAG31_NODE_2675_length_5267_cov_6.821594_2_plen_131_part_00
MDSKGQKGSVDCPDQSYSCTPDQSYKKATPYCGNDIVDPPPPTPLGVPFPVLFRAYRKTLAQYWTKALDKGTGTGTGQKYWIKVPPKGPARWGGGGIDDIVSTIAIPCVLNLGSPQGTGKVLNLVSAGTY